jgi:biopolymer transport protein ExbB
MNWYSLFFFLLLFPYPVAFAQPTVGVTSSVAPESVQATPPVREPVVAPPSQEKEVTPQEKKREEEKKGIIQGFLEFMEAGGFWTWPIFFAGLLGLGLIIERIVALFFRFATPEERLYEEVKAFVTKGNIREAIQHLQRKKNTPIVHVFLSILRNADKGEKAMNEAMEMALVEVVPKIEARTGYLNPLANIATLLGLLGTVLGLITAFAGLAYVDPSQKQLLLAKGIAEAMHCTALGLFVAIPLLLSQVFLQGKTNVMIQRIQEYSTKLLGEIAGVRSTGG